MSYPVLYEATETFTAPVTQGLGTLSDCISCTVTEERNGMYELMMQYPITGIHFDEIHQKCLVLAKPNYTDNPQAFRIYRISKPLNGICTIYAQHISYDLSGIEMPNGYAASGLTQACELLSQYSSPFVIRATKTGSANFIVNYPASVRSWLGGKTGSFLDLYGGEWKWDMYTCTLTSERGSDRGVTIRYGKNLTSLTQEEECSNIYTHVRPWYMLDTRIVVGGLISTGATVQPNKTMILDCSAHFGSEIPTVAQLNAYAQTYIQSNNLTAPRVNLTLNFVQLKGLRERVDLCDTVTIEFEQLGVSAKAKCIKTVWDVLEERYTSTTFGDAISSFTDTVIGIRNDVTEEIEQSQSELEVMVRDATATITGNSGGYVILHDSDNDGKPDEVLVMDTADINTATKVWRWNKNGLGYSSTGYDGEYGLAMTMDGQIVADYITAGKMTANMIQGGVLKLGGTNNVNGELQILNASGQVIGTWNNNGISVTEGFIKGDLITAGKISSENGLVYFDLDNNVLQCSSVQGQYRTYYPDGTDAGNPRMNFGSDSWSSRSYGYIHLYNTLATNMGLRIYAGTTPSVAGSNINYIRTDSDDSDIVLAVGSSNFMNSPHIRLSDTAIDIVRGDTSSASDPEIYIGDSINIVGTTLIQGDVSIPTPYNLTVRGIKVRNYAAGKNVSVELPYASASAYDINVPNITLFPLITRATLGMTNTDTQTYFQKWIKYVTTRSAYATNAKSNVPIIAPVAPNATGVILGYIYGSSGFNDDGTPQYAHFLYEEYGSKPKVFGYKNYEWYYDAVDTTYSASTGLSLSGTAFSVANSTPSFTKGTTSISTNNCTVKRSGKTIIVTVEATFSATGTIDLLTGLPAADSMTYRGVLYKGTDTMGRCQISSGATVLKATIQATGTYYGQIVYFTNS